MNTLAYKHALKQHFSSMRLERRNKLMENILQNRTRYITVALENIYQPHNASAVLRTCDCFGVQDVHIIENSYAYEINPQVAVGAAQWLNMHRYNTQDENTVECLNNLKKAGYRIVATSPGKGSVSIYDFNLQKGKFALLFGTERQGLTEQALAMADETVHIPMYGFTESFNISVSVSLCLFHFTRQLREQHIPWQLTDEEMLDIQLEWFRNTVKNSYLIEKKFAEEYLNT